MTIYQEGRDRYIVSDIYSLKFIELDVYKRQVVNRSAHFFPAGRGGLL